jgi:hypothetical protein
VFATAPNAVANLLAADSRLPGAESPDCRDVTLANLASENASQAGQEFGFFSGDQPSLRKLAARGAGKPAGAAPGTMASLAENL